MQRDGAGDECGPSQAASVLLWEGATCAWKSGMFSAGVLVCCLFLMGVVLTQGIIYLF